MDSLFENQKVESTPVNFDPFADGDVLLTAPATKAQKEIWASVKMGDGANCAYNESITLNFKGRLDFGTLQAAWQNVIERHESLRTTISPDGNNLCITTAPDAQIYQIDLSMLSSHEQDAKILELKQQAVTKAFDLEHGPLCRTQLLKLSPEQHQLVLTAHHVICDGWSWAVIVTELGQLYSAKIKKTTAELEEVDRFSDYALTLEETANEPEAIAAEEYWVKQFSDSVPILDFPTDRPRPALRTFDSQNKSWQIEATVVTALKQLGTKYGCSFMTVMLSSFEVFLHRLTGQKDLVVGVPASGQAATGNYNLVGHCVNLLPLRTEINPQESFGNYLQKRKTTILDAYDNQQFTFGSLVQKLKLTRDPSRIPLVPIVFNIDQALDDNALNFAGLEVDFSANPRAYENFELFINAVDSGQEVVLECQYNTNLFDSDSINLRLAEFTALLSSITANPDEKIGTIDILPEAEKQLLSQWNQTETAYPQELCIHQLVEAQAAKTPDAIAVIFEDSQITYQELNQKANSLASYLISVGVKPEEKVGICLERSIEMVIGLLGILKAGGAYVPIDPAYPAERISFLLTDSQIAVLVTQASLTSELPEHSAKTLCLDTDWEKIANSPTVNPVDVNADNLAYVIYTSGSTGTPKGVLIPHRNVVNLLSSIQQKPGLTPEDILLSVTTISFDIAASEIFLPLSVGAKLVIASQQVASDGMALLKTLNSCGATFMQPTPITWRLLLEAGWQGSPNLKMISTGEALPRELANKLLPLGKELWNLYGPSETTIWSTRTQVKESDRKINIGHPIANTQAYILDRHMEPVPIGVPGELHIGGAGVAREYLNRPELNTAKFIANPFSSDSQSRLYKTGDLAKFLPDGEIECLGRIDYQVKVRGFRIELGEIETTMTKYPSIKEAVVIAREDNPGEKTLAGYFIGDTDDQDAIANKIPDLRQFLKEKLPNYMVPTQFMALTAMPLTPNGKVDRKALPKPDNYRADLAAQYVAPRNEMELEIANIWAEVLGMEKVGIYDNFFELGGYSLLAIQIISRLRQSLQIEIFLPDLFELPTVAELSTRISALLWATQSQSSSEEEADYEEGEL